MARGKVVFNEDRCKGCELCTTVCPQKILVMSETINKLGYHPATVSDPDKCTGCATCARICPDCVIKVYRQ
ncbi:MAG TPA: 4Fe-4S binding protein [Firmicutes bacterium]|nr:4Fe-4S binding protein [Bacillota bacterium]